MRTCAPSRRAFGPLLGAALVAAPLGSARSQNDDPLARLRPHPVITEVLFNVPNDATGDANKDGVRDATGDEFVEMFNPHARTVNLRGYTILSRMSLGDDTSKKGVRFTFPDLELPPGAVVVVFNGYKAQIKGPVGTADRAPPKVHPEFAKAGVFSMGTTAKNRSWNNAGDFVLLQAPDGTPVDAIWWGEPSPAPPPNTLRCIEAPAKSGGSVQRTDALADPAPHADIDGAVCSPGSIPAARTSHP